MDYKSRLEELQIGAVWGISNRSEKITNRSRGFKLGQRDLKSELRLQFGAKEITNRGMDFKLGQGLRIGAEHSTTVFEYSESEYCFNSKVGLWIFTIQRLLKVTRASLYLPLNGAKLCYTFLSRELRKIKEMQQS